MLFKAIENMTRSLLDMMEIETGTDNKVSVSRWKMICLNGVAGFILAMIGWCNLPDEVPKYLFGKIDRTFDVHTAYKVKYSEWCLRYIAHIAGLDNKWQMYGGQSRFNWKFVIVGTYRQGEEFRDVILPLPRQSERTFWQRNLWDFKEAKFHLNIYNDALARETYARYLARQYPLDGGALLDRVRFELHIQYIIPPMVAVKLQKLLEDQTVSQVISDFDVHQDVAQRLQSQPQWSNLAAHANLPIQPIVHRPQE